MDSTIPGSITFGSKLLPIPSLEEVGIPMAGLGIATLNPELSGGGFAPRWVDRGDPLLTYRFPFFRIERKSWVTYLHDPMEERSFEIVSPISGLLVHLRNEYTVRYLSALSYEWSKEFLLPVLLVPEDEPPADAANFYLYDEMCSFLTFVFERIPLRDHSKMRPDRLGDWMGEEMLTCERPIRND